MANETELSNIKHVTDTISDAISPALVQGPVMAPLIYYEPLPVGTNVRLMRKDGSLTAESISESTAHAVDASGQELTQSSVTLTAVKLAANCMLTVEAQQFTNITLADIARYIGEALQRLWEAQIVALTSGFSNAVHATSTLTFNDILEAAYNVRANTYGVSNGPLVGVFDFKGIHEIRKEQWNSSAAALSLPQTAQLLTGYDLGKAGFQGERGGVFIYQLSGLPTSSSDDVGLVYDPAIAFAATISDRPLVRTRWIGGTDGTRGYVDEVSGYIFQNVAEWNDGAGCGCESDT